MIVVAVAAALATTSCSPPPPHGPTAVAGSGGYSVVAAHINRPADSIAVDADRHTVYLGDQHDIDVVDTVSHESVTSITSRGTDVALSPDGHELYAVGNGLAADGVTTVDVRTLSVTTIAFPSSHPDNWGTASGLAIDSGLRIAIAPFYDSDKAAAVDLMAGRFLGAVDVGEDVPSGARLVAVDPRSHRAYITATKTIAVIDLSTRPTPTRIRFIPIPMVYARAMAFDPVTGYLIVVGSPNSIPDDDDLLIVDPRKQAVVATVPITLGSEDVAVDSTAQTAYVTSHSGNISVIDLTHRTVTAVLRVDGTPYAVAVDPAAHTAYATNRENGDLDIVTRH
jgi:DNA-binding beta-propeller fold protein YncE